MSGDAEPNADKWARPDETRERIVEFCRSTWELADATIDELPLDAVGRVGWWGDSPVTLHRVLVHMTCETQRHAGHADIIRESIDGAAGFLRGSDNLHISDPSLMADVPRPDRRGSLARRRTLTIRLSLKCRLVTELTRYWAAARSTLSDEMA